MSDHSALLALGNIFLGLCAWLVTYTGLPAEPAVILAVMMMIDFVSGLGAAYAADEPITSKKMRLGALSKMLLLFMPLIVAIAAKGMGADFLWLVTWVVNLMILSELYSFISNIYCIKKGNRLPEWDVVQLVGKRLQKVLDTMME